MESFFKHYFIELIFFILVVIPTTFILKKILKKPFAETLDLVEKIGQIHYDHFMYFSCFNSY
jgi:hypothetical protein